MSLTRYPSENFIHPLYNPIRLDWDFALSFQPNQPNDILESIRVEVVFEWGDVVFVDNFQAFAIRNTQIQGAIKSDFELDLSGIIKPYSHPNSKYTSIPFGSVASADFLPHGKVTGVNIYINIRLISGVLQEDLVEEITEPFYINSAAIQRWDLDKSFVAYYDKSAVITSTHSRRFLTKDNYLRVQRNATRWISLFQDAGDNFRILLEYYDNTGTQIVIDLDAQLGNTGVCAVKIDPSVLPSYVKRFTYRAYNTHPTQGGQISETIVFYIEDCDCTQMMWVNDLGGIDAFYFCGEQEGAVSSNLSSATATPRNLSTLERGVFRVQSNGSENYIIRDSVTYEVLLFLKYLQLTPEAYIFINAQWCNCVVLDAKFPTFANYKGHFDIELTLELNNPISQTN